MAVRLATQLSRKELLSLIRETRKELRGSLSEVREESRTSPNIPTYAVDDFDKLEKDIRKKTLKRMTNRELVSVVRKLEYIKQLDSSTLSGALEVANKFEPFKNYIGSLSKTNRNKFWRVYRRFYRETSQTAERFKYEIFNEDVAEMIVRNIKKGEGIISLTGKLKLAYEAASLSKFELNELAYRALEQLDTDIINKVEVENISENVLFSKSLKSLL